MSAAPAAGTPPEDLVQLAAAVFGGRGQALAWFRRRAMFLDDQRPVDLLATPEGLGVVQDYLVRIAYGVYS